MSINETYCFFNDVSERDMDMLFLEEFVCSEVFLRLFTGKVGIDNAKVLSVHASKTDAYLGESDITVVVETNGEQIGLLIEDKIDAIAMPNQAKRYFLRGEKGIEQGEYDRFFVFIVAPQKYLSQNIEAQIYPNKVEYESILSYFEELNDARAAFKIQQIKQAIEKQKKGYQVEIDPAVTDFWIKYSEYQKAHFPDVYLVYNGESKGSNATWPRFNTVVESLYMYHKTGFGFVDMTFDGCADMLVEIERLITDAVGDYLIDGFSIHRTGKSGAIRLMVPKLDLHMPFEGQVDKVEEGLSAVKKMSVVAKLFDRKELHTLLDRQKQ